MDPSNAAEHHNHLGIAQWNALDEKWVQVDEGLMSDYAYMDLKSCDLNADGLLDLVAINTALGGLVYLGVDNKDTAKFELAGKLEDVYGKSKIDIGDINGDGAPDIVVSLQRQKNGIEGGVRTLLNKKELWN